MRDDAPAAPNPADATPDGKLLDHYVTGECTPLERTVMERWLAAHPSWRDALRTMRRDAELGRSGWGEPVDEVRAEHQLQARAGWVAEEGQPANVPGAGRARTAWGPVRQQAGDTPAGAWGTRLLRRSAWYGVPGLLVILVLLGTWSAGAWRHRTARAPERVTTYVTGNGQRATITLSDGSRVTLNVASQLEVPADYDRGNHAVHLTGEALFTVDHRDGQPFTVTAGTSTTRVLGTSFAVRRYASDTAAVIAVREGKVSVASLVRPDAPPRVLAGMQQALVVRSGPVAVRSAAPAQFAFADGVLELTDVALPDAIPMLNRWYDVDIRLGDPALAKLRVGGGFKAGSVTDLMGVLELVFDVRPVRNGRIVTLYPKR